MSGECGRARRLLWPDVGPRVADEETAAARRHVQGCADCRAFFEEMTTMCGAIRASLGNEAAPIELREEMYSRLAEARLARPIRPEGRWRAAAAAVVVISVLIAGALVLPHTRAPVPPIVSMVAAEHARAVSGDHLSSPDRDMVESWLTSRVTFGVHVPQFTGARLTGARLCHAESGRGAVIEYAIGDRTLSYFILPSSPGAFPSSAGLQTAAGNGYRMVLWRDTGLVHALVGALSHEELERLAHECIEQAMRLALAGAVGFFTRS